MDSDELNDDRLSDVLRRQLSQAPPVASLVSVVRRRQRRRRVTAGVAGVVAVIATVGSTGVLRDNDTSEAVVAGPSDEMDVLTPQDPRPPTELKRELIDALVATAPSMLAVTELQEESRDRGLDPELASFVRWDFADPALFDLENPPAGVDEWVNGDPGGGTRAMANIRVTPGFDFDQVENTFSATVSSCRSCDFAGYHEVPNSYVQWIVIKDDAQINVTSERPEVWPEMRAWFDRFTDDLDEVAMLSEPAASDNVFPEGLMNVNGLQPTAGTTEDDTVVLLSATLSFEPAASSFSATVACRTMIGAYAVDGNRLLVREMSFGREADCELPEIGLDAAAIDRTASQVFAVLESDPTWRRHAGQTLILTTGEAELTLTIGTPGRRTASTPTG